MTSALDLQTQRANAGRGSGAGETGFSALSAEDFTKIILSEMSRQDPLQPNDTGALLEQLSSIRSIQSDLDLTKQLTSLVAQNDFASAATLIGRTVSGVSDVSSRVSGVVESVSRTSTGTSVRLQDGSVVPMKNLDRVVTTPTQASGG